MQQEYKSKRKAVVVLTEQLASQIQFLHNQCPKGDEWSGLLIYKVEEGSVDEFTKPENDKAYLELRAIGVYPMDYGDGTFTSFEGNEDWLKCFKQFPEVDPISPTPGWYIGKIHSHHTMSTWHSGVDKGDLYENADKLPIFLSLIVNYACEADCELAISIDIEEKVTTKSKWKLKNWIGAKEEEKETLTTRKAVYIIDCDVVYEQEEWLITQAEALKTKKKPTFITQYTPPEEKPKGPKKASKYYKHALDNMSALITLGTNDNIVPYKALEDVSRETTYLEVENYKKAFKYFFIDSWYDETFYNCPATIPDAIEATLEFIEIHDQKWIYKFIKEALNELSKEFETISQPVQRFGVV